MSSSRDFDVIESIKQGVNVADNSKTEGSLLTYKKLTPKEERRLEAFYREKAERDRITMLADATNKGRAEGRTEGRAESEAKMIAKMRASGMTESQIKSILSIDDEQLAESNSADEDDEDDWDDGR